ncbi:MAG: GxxExxY protein [Muribaculaceae bacterium]|nr:GxxExxY protein [Muribaculaceae bacterium]
MDSKGKISDKLHSQLKDYVYPVIACMHEVHNELKNGLPEYVYQEALAISLRKHGFNPLKEYQHHIEYMGEKLKSHIRMDIVLEMPRGNVIIECKSIASLGDAERYQTFGYLRGTKFPIAILVNFGTFGKAQIERYYFHEGDITAF